VDDFELAGFRRKELHQHDKPYLVEREAYPHLARAGIDCMTTRGQLELKLGQAEQAARERDPDTPF